MFPIHFLTDEAANAVLASQVLADGLQDAPGQWFPVSFASSEESNPSPCVHLQVLPRFLIERSVCATRVVSALVGLLGALAVRLTLKDPFSLRVAWVGMMSLANTPTWMLHYRTAFEMMPCISRFARFLCKYQRFRAGRSRTLMPANGFGGLAVNAFKAG
jgi:hypothetical protein